MPPSSSAPPPETPHRRRGAEWVLAALGVCLCLGLAIGGVIGAAAWRYRAPGPLPTARAVVVPAGTTTEVADALVKAGVIRAPRLFALTALATRRAGPLHAAELQFPAHASFATVLAILRTAPPVEHRLTIPEGLTAQQITALLEHAPALTGPADLPAEGWILPNTYDYLYGTLRAAIIARAHAAFVHTLATLWADRAPDLPLSTPAQALTLASIVERETALPSERPRVAAVFENRLRLGMKLQADPTAIYAASNGAGTLPHPLTEADLATDSPYNTYRTTGLPPGPIDAPGIAAITATLHPTQSPDLYFVADGLGGHAFSRTLAGQNHNITLWQERIHSDPP